MTVLSGANKRFWLVALITALALAAGAVGGGARPVYAHALLVRADPPVNSQLREPPGVLTLYFSEAVEHRFTTARVTDSSGARVDTGVSFDDTDTALMRVQLKDVRPGFLSVNWASLSAVDGHRISGSYPLTVLNADGSRPPGNPASAQSSVSGVEAKPTRVVAKWTLLAGGSALAGSLFFLGWVVAALLSGGALAASSASRRRCLQVCGLSVIVLLVAGVAEVLIQAASIGSVSDVGNVVKDTTWGERWLIRNALLLPIAAGIFVMGRQRPRDGSERLLVVALSALVLAYLALVSSVSHAAAVTGAFWAGLSDLVHLVASSVWFGMLLQLGLLVVWARRNLVARDQPPVLATALQRFSMVALISVAVLLVTGTLNGVIQVAKPADLLESAYGRTLLVKLVIILPLLVAAGVNAYLFRPRIVVESMRRRRSASADATLSRLLARTIRLELGLLALVLLAVGFLYQTPPTRIARAAPDQGGKFTANMESAPGSNDNVGVTLVVDPSLPGDNSYEVYLSGAVDSVESVTLKFLQEGSKAGESRLIMDASNPPTFYVGRGPFLSDSGNWKITVNLRRTRGADLDVPFTVKVGGAAAVVDRGGSAFAAPKGLTPVSLAVVGLSVALALGMVLGSLPRPGLPAGYLSTVAWRVEAMRISPAVGLAALVLLGGGLGLLVDHAHKRLSQPEAAKGNPVASSPESIARGKLLFSQNCIMCHGESGRGDGPLAKTLPIQPANLYDHIPYHPDSFFYSVMTNGLSGVMPSFGGSISEEDRWNILNYLRDSFGQPPPAQ